MRRPTRLGLLGLLGLVPPAALASQVANFNISQSTAEAHDCGTACQVRLSLAIPADVHTVGRDFDEDFYATAGNFSQATSQPGDVLKLEAVDPTALKIDGGATTYRFQYVSVGTDGAPVPATGFVAFPFTPHILPGGEAAQRYRVAAFAHGTIGIYHGCAPSNGPQLYDYFTWQPALKRGYAIVATDYAGLGNNYTSHKYLYLPDHASDVHYSVVAARKLFGASLTDEWVSFGHSQGGGAAWKLAESKYVRNDRSYLGTVAVAPATYVTDQLFAAFADAANSSSSSSGSGKGAGVGFLPLIPESVARVIPSYNESILAPVLRQRAAMAKEAQLCLKGVFALTADLDNSDIVSVAGALRDRPTLLRWQKMLAPAQGDASPAPILVIQGQSDTAVRWQTTVDAWEAACGAGNEVHLRLFPTQGHRPSLSAGAPEWLAWLDARFEQKAASSSADGGGASCAAPAKRKCTKYTRGPFNQQYVRAPTDLDFNPFLGPVGNLSDSM